VIVAAKPNNAKLLPTPNPDSGNLLSYERHSSRGWAASDSYTISNVTVSGNTVTWDQVCGDREWKDSVVDTASRRPHALRL